MIVTICDRLTGRVLARGDDGVNSPLIRRLLAEGHTRVEGAAPSPQHRWDGSGWAEDAELVAAKAADERAVALAHMDAGMIRVCEDLVAVLVQKGVIALADLPAAAQAKIVARKALR